MNDDLPGELERLLSPFSVFGEIVNHAPVVSAHERFVLYAKLAGQEALHVVLEPVVVIVWMDVVAPQDSIDRAPPP